MAPAFLLLTALLAQSQSADIERLFQSGLQKIKNQNFDAAIADFSKVIELNPKHVEAYSERGWARHLKRDPDAAISDFSRALSLDPRNVMAAYRRAASHGQKRDMDRAIEDYSLCIRLNPRNSVYFSARGGWLMRSGKLDAALADYNQNLILEPKSATGHYVRAILRRERKDPAGALADITKAIELNPREPGHFEFRGHIAYDRMAWKEALADYRKACEMEKQRASFRFRVWLTRCRLGERDAATAELSAFVAEQKDLHPWYRNIADFLCGEKSEEAFLAHPLAKSEVEARENQGELCFYAATRRLLSGDPDYAKLLFQKAADLGEIGSGEHLSAQAELDRLAKKGK